VKQGKPLQRKTPLVAKTGLRRVTPLQQRAGRESLTARQVPLQRTAIARKPPKPKLTPEQKRPLIERSGGWCELRIEGVCLVVAHDVAHRIGEGMGGRKGAAAVENDRLSNVLHACRACHRRCHDYPATARGHGWMLRNGDNPPAEPVFYCNRWVVLDDDGGVTPHRGEEVA
jgi:hypothetical protein